MFVLISDALQPTESSLACPTDQTLPLFIVCGLAVVYSLFITVSSCYFCVSIHICNHALTRSRCSLQQGHVLYNQRYIKEFKFGISQNQDLKIVSCASTMKLLIHCFYFQCKLKNPEPPENPYMNTRPGGFRRH